jgi:hypothetical protein
VELARLARAAASGTGRPPKIVVVTADLPADRLAQVVAAVDPDEVQLTVTSRRRVAAIGRPGWRDPGRPDAGDAVSRPVFLPRVRGIPTGGRPHRAAQGSGSTRAGPRSPEAPITPPAASTPRT